MGSGISGLTFAAAMQHFDSTIELQLYERHTALDAVFRATAWA